MNHTIAKELLWSLWVIQGSCGMNTEMSLRHQGTGLDISVPSWDKS